MSFQKQHWTATGRGVSSTSPEEGREAGAAARAAEKGGQWAAAAGRVWDEEEDGGEDAEGDDKEGKDEGKDNAGTEQLLFFSSLMTP